MTLKFLEDVGKTVSSPFTGLAQSTVNLATTTEHHIVKGAGTVADWGKGITKGAYSLGKDITGGWQQLTSPVGMIAVAVIVVGALILTRRQ